MVRFTLSITFKQYFRMVFDFFFLFCFFCFFCVFFCFLPISLITSHPDRIYALSIIYETLEVSVLSRVWSGVYLVLVLVPHFIQSSSIPNEKKFCMWCKSNLKTFLPLDDATTWVKLFLTVDATCGSILLSSSRSELFDCELYYSLENYLIVYFDASYLIVHFDTQYCFIGAV